jgi:hypothetical protein
VAEGVRLLEPLPQLDRSHPGLGRGRTPQTPGQTEAFVEGLEPVGELELVAIRAAEELDSVRTLGDCNLDRVERVEPARRIVGSRRVEADSVDVHAPLEREEVVERDWTSVDLQGDDPWHVDVGEREDRSTVETPSGWRRETRAVGAAVPAERVQLEGVLESGCQLVVRPGDRHLDLPELGEVPPPAPLLGPLLRGHLRLVDVVPVALDVEHGCFRPLYELELRIAECVHQAASAGQAEKIREVVARARDASGQGSRGRDALTGGDEKVGERRVRSTDEGEYPQPVPRSHAQRECADESSVPVGDMNGQVPVLAVVPPPLEQPAVKQHGARPRHRPNEAVPVLMLHPGEGVGARDRLERQPAWSHGRAHVKKIPPAEGGEP